MPNDEYTLPALTAGIQNQGLNNFVPRNEATVLKNVISISANGANTGATFYQSKEFTVLQDAYAIKWKSKDTILSDNHYKFLTASISKSIFGKFDWTNKAGWERVKSEKINLPLKNGEIDFKFMEIYVNEIETERLRKLDLYLLKTGLKDFTLTINEQKILSDFKLHKFKEFKVVDIFNIKNAGNILSRDVVENSGETPYLSASAENNAVSSYISYDEKYLDKGNCVFIGGKTFVVTYQENDFYSNDSHNLVLYLKEEEKRVKLNQLYLTTCIKKSLGHKYSWDNSISSKKIQTDKVLLPVINNQPDFEGMEVLITAIQKLVIKDVISYMKNKIN